MDRQGTRIEEGAWAGESALGIPDWSQVKNKPRQFGVSGDSLRMVQYLDDPATPVDEHLTRFEVEEPAEAGAVSDICKKGVRLIVPSRTQGKKPGACHFDVAAWAAGTAACSVGA